MWVTEGGVWVTKGVCFYPYPLNIVMIYLENNHENIIETGRPSPSRHSLLEDGIHRGYTT